MSESDSDDSSSSSVPMPELMPHPLFEAIASGDLDTVKRLIANVPVDCTHLVSDIGTTGWTPLERAAYSGRVEVVKYLIGEGADINRRGQIYGNTPLHNISLYPKRNDHVTCVKVLLAAGADVNAKGYQQDSPLDVTLQARYSWSRITEAVPPIGRRIVSVLLHAGATISENSGSGWNLRIGAFTKMIL